MSYGNDDFALLVDDLLTVGLIEEIGTHFYLVLQPFAGYEEGDRITIACIWRVRNEAEEVLTEIEEETNEEEEYYEDEEEADEGAEDEYDEEYDEAEDDEDVEEEYDDEYDEETDEEEEIVSDRDPSPVKYVPPPVFDLSSSERPLSGGSIIIGLFALVVLGVLQLFRPRVPDEAEEVSAEPREEEDDEEDKKDTCDRCGEVEPERCKEKGHCLACAGQCRRCGACLECEGDYGGYCDSCDNIEFYSWDDD